VEDRLNRNALKFTPAGGTVRLTVRACTAEQNSSRQSEPALEVTVADTGVGIDPSELNHIFDRFYRTRSALDMAVQGTGLGLPIANAMIEAQGGHISVTSTPGEGSTFTVTLPAAARIAATI